MTMNREEWTVGALRRELEKYPDDMPVLRRWNCSGYVGIRLVPSRAGVYQDDWIHYSGGGGHVSILEIRADCDP